MLGRLGGGVRWRESPITQKMFFDGFDGSGMMVHLHQAS